ncbi:MAG: hypothetical protein J6S12_04305 [Alphaproteobacteria bacterium]|nr:hypothetical protein [Alphaproteobacteria bacterium]
MAEKSIKKTATKKTVAKKTVSKPAATKKTVAKKAPVKKVVSAPVAEMYECGCAHGCACHGHCCDKKKCTFGRFLKKLVVFLIIFALGFATAKLCCFDKRGKMPFRPEFENGCLVVKCPKMAEKVAMMDVNHDGCVNREEFRAARKMNRRPDMRKHEKMPKPAAPEMPAPETVVAE